MVHHALILLYQKVKNMKYRIICLLNLFLLTYYVAASQGGGESVVVENGMKFKIHTVATGETIYGLGRLYNVSAAKIIAANGNATALRVGQKVKIPLGEAGKITPSTKPIKEPTAKIETPTPQNNAVPNYHLVAPGETLTGIARKYNMTVDQLQQINSMGDNILSVGQKLFLSRGAKAKFEDDRANEEIEKTANTTATTPPKTTADSGNAKAEDVPTKDLYQMKESGEAAWVNDADLNPNKYFALHRTAPNGTIMKVTNKMNNKFVFVKVIGKLPDTGDNNNLIIKLSQAAATKLGVLDNRFQSEITYSLVDHR